MKSAAQCLMNSSVLLDGAVRNQVISPIAASQTGLGRKICSPEIPNNETIPFASFSIPAENVLDNTSTGNLGAWRVGKDEEIPGKQRIASERNHLLLMLE